MLSRVVDYRELVEQACRAIRADPRLGPALGIARATARDPLKAALTTLVGDTLARRAERAVAGFAAFIGPRRLTCDEYDRLAHYVLSAALARRVGPDRLILIGATLTSVRAAVQPGPPRC
ncbi:hypothetical protein RB614_04940 [Phytohabitans sp. ZYX-F-186]|uniref:Uncharacterized protein n=1 Tax=Phytohabitans maris TaxID=3071409 RepID=A0ABU0ZA03_9ACTN|nr:hypothetical protein [Phytohabitans sp. ZYX-F-186]MDQ7903865.1 hypothetical protein [Phytohabitans sp. ZYX-F-186]